MKRALWVLAILALGALGWLAANPMAHAADDPESLKGKPAPAIALKTIDGNDLSLADMKGKVVLIDMWATWCPPCQASLPHVQKTSGDKALADKGLVVWAVDAMETKPVVSDFLKKNNYTFTVLMDDTGAILKAYFVSGIPTTVIVGRDGTVKDVFVGYDGDDSAKAIDAAVDKALAEPAPK
jgi:peroxiredoxin